MNRMHVGFGLPVMSVVLMLLGVASFVFRFVLHDPTVSVFLAPIFMLGGCTVAFVARELDVIHAKLDRLQEGGGQR